MQKLLLIVSGPALVGACAGIGVSAQTTIASAGTLPGVVIGLAVLMVPALYIGLALLDAAPEAADVLDGAVDGLVRMGMYCLGLAPALLFLAATSASEGPAVVLARLVLAVGALVALWRFGALVRAQSDDFGPAASAVFGVWALTGLVIGWAMVGA